MAEANSGEAVRCLDIARRALASEDYDRAARFAEKALRLYPSDQARFLLAAACQAHTRWSACGPAVCISQEAAGPCCKQGQMYCCCHAFGPDLGACLGHS